MSTLVTTEKGDSLELINARPGEPYATTFGGPCDLKVPSTGEEYTPCGYANFYDANLETSEKVPSKNIQEDAEWDACGRLITSGQTKNWYTLSTPGYLSFLPRWLPGHHAGVPADDPDLCYGTWTMKYKWTQTFSNGEILTDEVTKPFEVVQGIPPANGWGGGNPTELPCQMCGGDPVNTATGDYFTSTTDLAIPGRGPGLSMTRTYSSRAAKAGATSALGRGWTFNYDVRLYIDPESGAATIRNWNGSRTEFVSSAGDYVAPPRVLATLVKNEDGSFTYVVKRTTTYSFDPVGRLVAIADRNGESTTLSYDEVGDLEKAVESSGRAFTFSFDEMGLLHEVADETGRSVVYEYSETGDLEKVLDVEGNDENFSYDEDGLLLSQENQRGITDLVNTYDGQGRVLTQLDASEGESTFSYVAGANDAILTTETTPRGRVTEYRYKAGLLEERTEAAGAPEEATWKYEYDPQTHGLVAVTDPNGKVSRASYDENGNQESTEDPMGRTTTSEYSALNELIEFTDPEGTTTTFSYDEAGNLLEVSTPLTGSEPAVYETVKYGRESEAHPGDVTAITDPNGETTQMGYDSAGNLSSTRDAEGNETTFAYDERGQLKQRVTPRGNSEESEPSQFLTEYFYDLGGRLIAVIDPLGREEAWSYDEVGNATSFTDRDENTTTYTYNAMDRLTEVERPEELSEQAEYDAAGNVTWQIDGMGRSTLYQYDLLNRLTSTSDPKSRSTEFEYDPAGNLVLVRDPEWRTTTFEYDSANQLRKMSYSDGATPTVEYDYDDNGRVESMIDGSGESTFEVDSLGRLVTAVDGSGDSTEYAYDLAGNQTGIVYPNEEEVAQEFDAAGRLTTVTDWLGNVSEFGYDADSNVVDITFPEATQGMDEYSYDRAGDISSVRFKAEGESLASAEYARDDLGRVESVATVGLPGASSESFEYDDVGRVLSAGSETFAYDAANNPIQMSGNARTFDFANELDFDSWADYGYGPAGERTRTGPYAASYKSAFGSAGSSAGEFLHPAGIAMDGEGDLWVADTENDRIQKFAQSGEVLGSFGASGSGPGQFNGPTDVAIDSEGHLWVADAGNNRIQEFSATGEALSQIGSSGSGPGEFNEPQSVAIDSNDHIWVADTYNGRVQEFDASGEFIKIIGTEGEEEETIFQATSIAIGPNNHLWVAEYGRCRVSEFTPEGNFVQAFGAVGNGDGQFFGSPMVEVDASGTIWVGDQGNQRIEKFDSSGQYLGEFGKRGTGDGEFTFGYPTGIASDGQGTIWVADSENNRIQRWEEPEVEPLAKTAYSYDQVGRLVSVERADRPESDQVDEAYSYDGNGLQATRTISGVTKQVVWDPTAALPSMLSDGDASFVYGPGGLPIAEISTGGIPTYLHHDQLGSTRLLTDATGSVAGSFSYGAYGELVASTGAQSTAFGFGGQYTAPQSGVQYLRARFYDPSTAQFLSRDPVTLITRQPYAYAFNDPINQGDPSGLGPCVLGLFGCDEDDDPCGSFWGVMAAGAMAPACLIPDEVSDVVNNAAAGAGDQLLSPPGSGIGPIPEINPGPFVRDWWGIEGVDECAPEYQGASLATEAFFLYRGLGNLPKHAETAKEAASQASRRVDEFMVHIPKDW